MGVSVKTKELLLSVYEIPKQHTGRGIPGLYFLGKLSIEWKRNQIKKTGAGFEWPTDKFVLSIRKCLL